MSNTTIAHTGGAAAVSTTGTAQGVITLRTVDFGGQREYLYTHPLFCTSRAVYALCVPLDKLFDKPPAQVVITLREYASMVQVRAPAAPIVVVFTKADQVPGMTPHAMPAAATRWIHNVMMALRAEFSQVAGAPDGDESTYSALVLSSKDGWEASQARVRLRWAQLALASPGAGDTLPASYGKMRDALGVVGAAWKNASDDGMANGAGVGVEETKGVEGGSSMSADATTASSIPLAMQWGVQVPIVTVTAVRAMAVEHCGLSHDADIHQPLLLLHHTGCVVYGGALTDSVPSHHDMQSAADNGSGDDATPSHPDLSQLVVLDPQWLANMLSRVVTQYARHHDDTGTPIPRGQVPLRDVALAWHGFPDELRGSFLQVLFALEVAFPGMAEDGGVSDAIIVPALLPLVPSNADEAVVAMLPIRKISEKQVWPCLRDGHWVVG